MRRLNRWGPAVLALGIACGAPRGGGEVVPVPQTVNASLEQFLAAVKANDLRRMGQLWGTESGPAAKSIDADVLRRRLTIIQRYLDHSGYRILEGPLAVPARSEIRTFRVELQRANCNHVLPIDVIQTNSGGWLVYDVHLESAGNPARRCPPPGAGTGP
ncbi:MAG: hypothetical protein ACREMN_11490 [Gemmatimonadales bacterium]